MQNYFAGKSKEIFIRFEAISKHKQLFGRNKWNSADAEQKEKQGDI